MNGCGIDGNPRGEFNSDGNQEQRSERGDEVEEDNESECGEEETWVNRPTEGTEALPTNGLITPRLSHSNEGGCLVAGWP